LRLPKTPGHVSGSACWTLIAILLCAFSAVSVGSANPNNSSSESERGENRSLSGTIPTSQGLQLTVQADCGDVQIFTDGANEVSYSLHPHSGTAARDPAALLPDFSLAARQTSRGVELISRALKETACRRRVIYEIHVPRLYSLNVAVQSGAISAQNIDGGVAFVTGGGSIRLGSVGSSDFATSTLRSVFAARLETAGGNISTGDIAGGLRATTGGGQISAGDVHGPAVLRTGGGNIRVGHVFGATRFSTGGGNIIANKIDGGIWAETDGGKVEIGNVRASAAFAPEFSAGEGNALATPMRARSENEEVLPFSDPADMSRFARLFDALFWGGIRVDSVEQQKHLVALVPPAYPEVARLAGIEGDVTLRILIDEDGTVRDLRSVLGPPVLARAAMRAVEQWRYAPALVDGHPVDVVTSVTFAFRLH
jgi:TonB family protein